MTVLTISPRVAPEHHHQVVVDDSAGDSVAASDDWGTFMGTVTNTGHTYNAYSQRLYAQLLIDQLVAQPPAV